ncbi:MAG: hypothetical protein V3W20_01860 [Candidatus Neomarinimicrobiota bacterium]
MKDKMKISGEIKVWITDNITGKKRLTFHDHNAIQPEYAEIIVEALKASVNYAIDAPFVGNGNPPTNGKDGICIKDSGGLWYGMIMAANARSGGSITFSGTFTGVAITVAAAADVLFGHNWQNAAPNDFTSVGGAYGHFAKPSSWVSQDVLITETMTIEWIINHY